MNIRDNLGIQEARLPCGHWVIVETLSGVYKTRDEAREAREQILTRRWQDAADLRNLRSSQAGSPRLK